MKRLMLLLVMCLAWISSLQAQIYDIDPATYEVTWDLSETTTSFTAIFVAGLGLAVVIWVGIKGWGIIKRMFGR